MSIIALDGAARRTRVAAAFCVGLAGGFAGGLAGEPAAAHPHAWFDGHAQLEINADGALTGMRVAVIADELSTASAVEQQELDLDHDGRLTAEEEAVAAQGLAYGLSFFNYFTALTVGGERVFLPAPRFATATLQDGLMAGRVDFTFATPIPLANKKVEVALYDPTYYVEVRMRSAPDVLGEGDCQIGLRRFSLAAATADTRTWLSRLGAEEAPPATAGGFEVGSLFADRADVSCRG